MQASVALVLHEPPGESPELLFIQRAEREGDPWSGHMAFPGGRRQAEDSSLVATALRETQEEVGFRPDRVLGRLNDFAGSRGPRIPALRVAGIVCEVDKRPRIKMNHEVRNTVWIPLSWILDPQAHRVAPMGASGEPMPSFCYDDYVVWGLTYRLLRDFFSVVGERLPLDPEELPSQADAASEA